MMQRSLIIETKQLSTKSRRNTLNTNTKAGILAGTGFLLEVTLNPNFMCSLLAALSFTPVALSEDASPESSSKATEHHIALSLGNGFVQNKTLNKFYDSYLNKQVGTQSYFALRYHAFADSKADYTSGFTLDLFNASSEQAKSYDFGDVKVGFKMMGLAAGWGLRQRILDEHLFFITSAQIGLIKEDIAVSTPTGSVEYKDFQAKQDLDSLVVKLACGVRWDFWKTLGVRADAQLARVATGDQLVALSTGVGYGL